MSVAAKKRKVTVELVSGSWVVAYVERKPRQRYWAATFYAADHSKEKVEQWVRKNPKLELV